MLLPGIGRAGQERLAAAHAAIIGCGALGSVIADGLARAGVGTLTIIDRDIVELTNLQRQILFDEADVAAGTPKAAAAAAKIARINSQVRVSAIVDDFNPRNAERLLGLEDRGQRSEVRGRSPDTLLDGLDNFETRYLLNDIAVKHGLPYIYGGAVGTTGMSLAILPRRVDKDAAGLAPSPGRPSFYPPYKDNQSTPCLRCIFPEAPPPGTTPTCDTAGVLGPVVMQIAALQVTQAIKILTGNVDALDRTMLSIDVWTNESRRFDVSDARSEQCPCCGQRRLEHLNATESAGGVASLCGRNAVQITGGLDRGSANGIDLPSMARTLSAHGEFAVTPFLLRGVFRQEKGHNGEAVELTLFSNGRAIIKGVTEPARARAIYAKYVGA